MINFPNVPDDNVDKTLNNEKKEFEWKRNEYLEDHSLLASRYSKGCKNQHPLEKFRNLSLHIFTLGYIIFSSRVIAILIKNPRSCLM